MDGAAVPVPLYLPNALLSNLDARSQILSIMNPDKPLRWISS